MQQGAVSGRPPREAAEIGVLAWRRSHGRVFEWVRAVLAEAVALITDAEH